MRNHSINSSHYYKGVISNAKLQTTLILYLATASYSRKSLGGKKQEVEVKSLGYMSAWCMYCMSKLLWLLPPQQQVFQFIPSPTCYFSIWAGER